MHATAMMNGQRFFDCYGRHYSTEGQGRVIDIGSLDVNGSLRDLARGRFEYIGVDFTAGAGVDLVLSDPYRLPFPDQTADIVVSSSCFEHSEMFWLVFLEVMRILRPRGLFYLNAPSNGIFHQMPVDCWRFYPDSGVALVSWGRRNGVNAVLLEWYNSGQGSDGWNDFVAVFLRDQGHEYEFPERITDTFSDFKNARVAGRAAMLKHTTITDDQMKLMSLCKLLGRGSGGDAQESEPGPDDR
jgi:SAM-dependent methyltransferase